MTQPPALRISEQVIEAFGVSAKYTIILIALGSLVLAGAVALTVLDDPILDAIVVGAGPLGPLVFLVIEVALGCLGVYLILRGIYLRLAYHFFLTNERVIEVIGFLAQRSVTAEYKMITDIIVRQDAISRLALNTGTLAINTPGGPGEEFVLMNIDNPTARREQLRRLSEAVQEGRAIDSRFLAALKYETGMARTTEEALEDIERSVGHGVGASTRAKESDDTALPQVSTSVSASASAASQAPRVQEGDVVDLHGDGIDESDRLRAAQKRIEK
ncbi:MAG: PH domain-containing protein [Patescibacteria group bacterium]|jgi:uncharacterized membrane protein YdbT with pleckstrin-like domain